MRELRKLAAQLLSDRSVGVVIGWEEAPNSSARPSFATTPAETERLIFDERCVQSLPVYLSTRRSDVARLGRPAVVVKACDARAIAGMIRELQLKREDLVVIGVRCGGVLHKGAKPPLTAGTVHGRCSWCQKREPDLVDYLVGEERPKPPMYEGPDLYGALEKMTHAGRLEFWAGQFSRCTRCYACRQTCPMCYCERCLADETQPQWIESSPHARGNFAWHFTRAMHQAGRCINCGECERACPVDIPLSLLNRKIQNVVADRFGYRVSDDPSVPSPAGPFDRGELKEFIL